jgi:hypothetical protein
MGDERRPDTFGNDYGFHGRQHQLSFVSKLAGFVFLGSGKWFKLGNQPIRRGHGMAPFPNIRGGQGIADRSAQQTARHSFQERDFAGYCFLFRPRLIHEKSSPYAHALSVRMHQQASCSMLQHGGENGDSEISFSGQESFLQK